MASYCQLCGLPLQHDHYVATDRPDSWRIYRSSQPELTRAAVAFGPEHQWLTRGVALDPCEEADPVFGSVEDGHLLEASGETHFVGDGYDDRAVLHQACWTIAGRPRSYEELACAHRLHAWVLMFRYQEQLFEFEQLVRDGRGDWLVDPETPAGAESRRRIESWWGEARRVAALDPVGRAGDLPSTNCWAREDEGDEEDHSFWRYRANLSRGLDLEGRDWVNFGICLPFEGVADGPHTLVLEQFESRLLEAVQDLAVILACRGEAGRWDYLCYSDRVEETEQAIRVLAGPTVEFDHAPQPGWEVYWTHIHPQLAGRYEEVESV
jgi:hypothetical protein